MHSQTLAHTCIEYLKVDKRQNKFKQALTTGKSQRLEKLTVIPEVNITGKLWHQ